MTLAARRSHRRDARDGADGVPDVRLVADARQPRAARSASGSSVPRTSGARGDGLSRRRRPRPSARCSTARRRSSARAADLPAGPSVRRRDARHAAPTSLTETQPWVEQSLFLAAIGEALTTRARRALEAFAYRYREERRRPSASSSTEPSSRATSWPTSASGRSARPDASELARLDFGGLQPVEEGKREKVLSCRAGGVPAGARYRRCRGRLTVRPLSGEAVLRDEELGDLDRVRALRPCAGCR